MDKMWNFRREGLLDNNVFCNLYKCCKKNNKEDLQTGVKTSTFKGMQRDLSLPLEDIHTLITHASDWGIKKHICNITGTDMYSYTIEDAAHGGVFLDVEISSVLPHVKRWYMTNMKSFLHEKIYPLPLGVNHGDDWDSVDIEKIRSEPKPIENLCYANFTITSPYRIRAAEWCWSQGYIDCNFPKRYDTEDVELSMPILKGERLEFQDFIKKLSSYKFAICPTGNGLDTFRTWECILCNTVPIVMDTWMNRVFSQIWPMIIVSKYEFENVRQKMSTFWSQYEHIEYDYSLLLEENFEELLNRIQYESNRLRRKGIQMAP